MASLEVPDLDGGWDPCFIDFGGVGCWRCEGDPGFFGDDLGCNVVLDWYA